MAYEPKTWQCGEVVSAEALNHIEQGIADASSGGGTEDRTTVALRYLEESGHYQGFYRADIESEGDPSNHPYSYEELVELYSKHDIIVFYRWSQSVAVSLEFKKGNPSFGLLDSFTARPIEFDSTGRVTGFTVNYYSDGTYEESNLFSIETANS